MMNRLFKSSSDEEVSYRRRKSVHRLFNISVLFCAITLIYVCIRSATTFKQRVSTTNTQQRLNNGNSKIFQAFHDCFRPKLESIEESLHTFWFEFAHATSDCDRLREYHSLDIRPATNKDEIKYVVFPKKKDEQLTMVTLGIGHDIQAELKLKKMHPNMDFYGADPGVVVNKDLYENKLGGVYYHYAVSGETGMQRSKVYTERGYTLDATNHISADFFFKHILKKDRIDILWIDIEQNEYGILEQIHQNGKLDEIGVKICQMNVEFHKDVFGESEVEMQKFYDFVYKVLDDGKYIILKPSFAKYKTIGFVRAFIVNVADKECTDLYLK